MHIANVIVQYHILCVCVCVCVCVRAHVRCRHNSECQVSALAGLLKEDSPWLLSAKSVS